MWLHGLISLASVTAHKSPLTDVAYQNYHPQNHISIFDLLVLDEMRVQFAQTRKEAVHVECWVRHGQIHKTEGVKECGVAAVPSAECAVEWRQKSRWEEQFSLQIRSFLAFHRCTVESLLTTR